MIRCVIHHGAIAIVSRLTYQFSFQQIRITDLPPDVSAWWVDILTKAITPAIMEAEPAMGSRPSVGPGSLLDGLSSPQIHARDLLELRPLPERESTSRRKRITRVRRAQA